MPIHSLDTLQVLKIYRHAPERCIRYLFVCSFEFD
uniref:Uncharacterized protein n=1 Tax=Arundo donax TaxID=35708 RepID=A0A0A9EN91_ARUDO